MKATAWLMLAAACLVGAGLRLADLSHQSFWHDECWTLAAISGLPMAAQEDQLAVNEPVTVGRLLRSQGPVAGTTAADVLRNVVHDEPVGSPLYYLLARLWAGRAGASPASIRLLSALLGLLALPCGFWLLRELRPEDPAAALIAAALIAVSPFHVFYSREARWYSLLSLTILGSSAAFLGTLRGAKRLSWRLYGATAALGLYTNVLFLPVLVAHGACLIASGSRKEDISAYAKAVLLAGAAYAPWAVRLPAHTEYARALVAGFGWVRAQMSLAHWSASSLFYLSSAYVDTGWLSGESLSRLLPRSPVIGAVLLLVAFSLVAIRQNEPPRRAWFVWLLAAVPAAALAGPDLVWGGHRANVDRYMTGAYLGTELAVSLLLARRVRPASPGRTVRYWRLGLGLLIAGGLLTSYLGIRREAWNRPDNRYDLEAARVINQAARPIVVIEGRYLWSVLPLAHRLRPSVTVVRLDRADDLATWRQRGDVFVYQPSEAWRRHWARFKLGALRPAAGVPEDLLWQLEKPA